MKWSFNVSGQTTAREDQEEVGHPVEAGHDAMTEHEHGPSLSQYLQHSLLATILLLGGIIQD